MKLIIICIILIVLLYFLPVTLYFKKGIGKWFYHDILNWHIPDNSDEYKYDGLNLKTICKHCKKEITQDSQGNWF